ncbi:hypothetical protein HDU98_012170 [Podochytrium sp. JEL0797]|nr:hypothetical protein HDU98_012170 [Podochytrium sp. JEL0797]
MTMMIDQLTKIWDKLHPPLASLSMSPPFPPPASTDPAPPPPPPTTTRPAKKSKKAVSAAPAAEVSPPPIASDNDTNPNPTTTTTSRKKKPTATSPPTETDQESINAQLHTFILSHPTLHTQMLRYEPLAFDTLHQLVKQSLKKCSKKTLQTFLDQRGIITRNSTGREG